MKIVKSSGCTANYTRVDGRDLHDDLTKDEQLALLNRLWSIQLQQGVTQTIAMLLDNMEGDYESGEYCDQCGDTPYKETYDLDDYSTETTARPLSQQEIESFDRLNSVWGDDKDGKYQAMYNSATKQITLTRKELQKLMFDTYLHSSRLVNPHAVGEYIDGKLNQMKTK